MNWIQIRTVWAKELRDTLRDRRTLFSMIAFPALIIPGCMLIFGYISFSVVKKARAETPSVMVMGGDRAPDLLAAFSQSSKVHVLPTTPDYAQLISEKKIRAAVEIPDDLDTGMAGQKTGTIKIYTYDGEMKSGFATGEIEHILNVYRQQLVSKKLAGLQLAPGFVRPFEIVRSNVAPPEKVGGNLFGGVIPYLLIFLSFMGAMYPAMDLSAGEKERGTMETILCSPVGRLELVLGKFFTILSISLSTVTISLLSMAASALVLSRVIVAHQISSGNSALVLPAIDPLGVLGVVGMVLPLAVLFSAGIFTISLFAKSHKEAQTYISPFMLLLFLPAVAAMLPGVELNFALALVPILNVSLISKEMVSGTFHPGLIALIFSSTCVYAGLVLAGAVRMFNRESVLFRS